MANHSKFRVGDKLECVIPSKWYDHLIPIKTHVLMIGHHADKPGCFRGLVGGREFTAHDNNFKLVGRHVQVGDAQLKRRNQKNAEKAGLAPPLPQTKSTALVPVVAAPTDTLLRAKILDILRPRLSNVLSDDEGTLVHELLNVLGVQARSVSYIELVEKKD